MNSTRGVRSSQGPAETIGSECRELAKAWRAEGLRTERAEALALRAAAKYLESSLELMHHIQREREASCRYLGAQGASHREMLAGSRAATDRRLRVFLRSLPQPPRQSGEAEPQGLRVDSRQAQKLATLLLGLAELTDKREEIARCRAPGHLAHTFYTELLARLLAVNFSTSDLLPAAAAVPICVALCYLADAKELADQERAWGSLCLAAGAVTREDKEKLADLIERQEQSLRVFEQLAPDFATQLLKIDQGGIGLEFENLRRQMALAAGPPSARLPELAAWFEAATWRLDRWREIEQTLLRKLQDSCSGTLEDGRGLQPYGEGDGAAAAGQTAPVAVLAEGRLPRGVASSLAKVVTEQARQIRKLNNELAAARRALDERKMLDRAKRLLMKHRGLTEPEAHRFLREEAMRRRRKIPEIAALLLDSDTLWNHGKSCGSPGWRSNVRAASAVGGKSADGS